MKLVLAVLLILFAPGLAFSQTEDRETAIRLLTEAVRNPVPFRVTCRCCIVDPDGPCCSGSCNIAMSALLSPISGLEAVTKPYSVLNFRDLTKSSPGLLSTSDCLTTQSIETCLARLQNSGDSDTKDSNLKSLLKNPTNLLSVGKAQPIELPKKKVQWPPASLDLNGLTTSKTVELK